MTLILLPNLLDESSLHEALLPMSTKAAVHSLQGLIAESEKSGRRYVRKFLSHEQMAALPIRLLNEHTKPEERIALLDPLRQGETWGLVTDAGLPCLADPGAELVALARCHGINVHTIAGPSSLIFAIQLSGLPCQRFAFHGYLPRETLALEQSIRDLEKRSSIESSTQLFIEAPYRSAKLLNTLVATLKSPTRLCAAISLTTASERVISQPVSEWKKKHIEIGKEPAVFLICAFE